VIDGYYLVLEEVVRMDEVEDKKKDIFDGTR
jgi:hypothetical protein